MSNNNPGRIQPDTNSVLIQPGGSQNDIIVIQVNDVKMPDGIYALVLKPGLSSSVNFGL